MNIGIAILFSIVASGPAPQVTNSSFENVDQQGGLPSGWSFTSLQNQSKLVQYKVVTVPGNKDSRALSITVDASHPRQRVAYNAHQDVSGIIAGKSYRVSATVQTHDLRSLPMLVVQCIDETGDKSLAFARSPKRGLKQDIEKWERIETVIKVPEGTSIFRLRIGIDAAGNAGGRAIIDDVKVTRVE